MRSLPSWYKWKLNQARMACTAGISEFLKSSTMTLAATSVAWLIMSCMVVRRAVATCTGTTADSRPLGTDTALTLALSDAAASLMVAATSAVRLAISASDMLGIRSFKRLAGSAWIGSNAAVVDADSGAGVESASAARWAGGMVLGATYS
ncbi:hypothetical protein BC828DRAFT_383914 [Blastocladiella britannica]|nr:hypothetical protein BC828DRAFT_383914 [Blastocladiella britannica]